MRWRSRVIGIAATACLIGVPGYFVLRVKLHTSPLFWPRTPFTTETWRASPAPQRYRLYNDLAKQGVLSGATRERVVQLLGRPDAEGREYITYVLRDRSVGEYTLNAVYLLEIDFDSGGVVKSYVVRAD